MVDASAAHDRDQHADQELLDHAPAQREPQCPRAGTKPRKGWWRSVGNNTQMRNDIAATRKANAVAAASAATRCSPDAQVAPMASKKVGTLRLPPRSSVTMGLVLAITSTTSVASVSAS